MTTALASDPGRTPGRPVLFTVPLVLFLLTVATVVGLALRSRLAMPDLPGAVRLLADGDADARERTRLLARVVEQAGGAAAIDAQWAGLLAAVALGDRGAYAASLARLGGPTALQVPEPAAREWLHLGDPMLGNVLAALVATAADDRDLARQKWSQVRAQARLSARSFALELATAALR